MPTTVNLLDGQWEYVESGAKHPGLFSGRGGGKTVAGLTKVFKYVGEHPGAVGVVTEPTTAAIERNLLLPLKQIFGDLEGQKVGGGWDMVQKLGSFQLRFPALDSVVFLRPAIEAGSMKGMSLAFFWMDEVSEGDQFETFMTLQPCLRQTGYPGQGWVSGTPHWRKRWVKQVWIDHINPRTETSLTASNYPIFRMKTADNVHLPEDLIAHLRESYGDTRLAQQELEGEFIVVEGPAFPMLKEEVHVRRPPEGMVFRRKVIGLDFGSVNPTALIELGLDQSNRVWALREFYKRNADDYDWIRTVRDWGGKKVICDPARSLADIETLRRVYGMPIQAARKHDFDTRYRVMASRLTIREDGYPGMYITPDCENLLGELQNLAFDVTDVGEVKRSRWERGSVDHAYDGCAYGLMEFEAAMVGRPVPQFIVEGYKVA